MKSEIQYAIIGIGAITVLIVLGVSFWPSGGPPAPEEIVEQIETSPQVEQRAAAARQMVYHAPTARREVRQMLDKCDTTEPKVVVPLIEATMKSRDWRSVPRLFELMEHEDVRIRGKAGAAARVIMGADYFFRANDPPEKRAEKLALMRQSYQRMIPEFARVYPEQK